MGARKQHASTAVAAAATAAVRAISVCAPGAFLAAAAAIAQTVEPAPLSADIPQQPLAEALAALTRQTGLQLIYESELARHRTSGVASAGMSANDALLHVLKGTGLQFSYLTPHSIRILAGKPASSPKTPAAPAREEPHSQMSEEVIVTAQLRPERALDVADSISVIGIDDIDRLHVTNLTDLAAAAPGFVIVSGGSPGQSGIVLRGLAPLSSQSLVTTVIDDSAVGGSTSSSQDGLFALDMLPYDVERIEILRGPQGTLYGANSMVGVLKYVTKDPSLTASEAQLGAEAFGIKRGGSLGGAARGAWSGPLVEDALAIRGSFYDQETPGYIKNPLRGLNHENTLSQRGGRLAILWQVAADFRIKLQGIYQRIDSDGNAIIFAEALGTPQDPYYRPGKWLYGDLVYPHHVPEPFTGELKFICNTLEWQMAFANLVSVTTFSQKRIASDMDNSAFLGYLQPILDPNTMSTLNRNRYRESVKRASQEIRLDSPSGQRLEWLAGLYYSDEELKQNQYIDALDGHLRPIPALTPFAAGYNPTSYTEAALFGTLTYRITDRFDLTAGLRWLTNRQRVETVTVPNHLIPTIDSIVHSAETPKTYSLGARFRPRPEAMLYLRVASGYRPGTPNLPAPGYSEIVPLAHSDTMVNYELGLKSELFNRRSTLNLSIFKINWSDFQLQITTPDGRIYYTVNAGNATSEGLEFEATQRLGDAVHIAVNAAHTHAYFTQAIPALEPIVGTPLPSSPRWTAGATLGNRMPDLDGWVPELSGTWRHVSSQYSPVSTASLANSLIPGYSWVDLNLRLTKSRYDFSLYAKNLLDKRAFNTGGVPLTSAFPTEATFSGPPIPPRTVGISATVTF